MELYDAEIKEKYYACKRKLKSLLNKLQTADEIIQVSNIHSAIDDIICDLVSYKTYDINEYKDIRNKRDRFYMKASSIDVNKEYIVMDIEAIKDLLKAESEETDGKKA